MPPKSEHRIPSPRELGELFGDIDIYLFDQIFKGRISESDTVLDAGCGGGRNLVYLLRIGCDVCAVDSSTQAIEDVRSMAANLAPGLPASNFRVETLDSLSFSDEQFDVIISNAVLHFAANESAFRAMLLELWRVLSPDGIFFSRLASTIGIEDRVTSLGGRRYRLPDGSERFLVDEGMLVRWTHELRGALLEPIKTVNVQNQRCMTTWCLRKRNEVG